MAFVVSVLVLQTLITVCLFFAVSQIYARVVATGGQGPPSMPVSAPTSVPSSLAVSELPPRTRLAAQAMGALRLLVVSPGCAACEAALDGLESSVVSRTTLVVAGYEVPTNGRLKSVVDEELARALVSQGATFPLEIELSGSEHQHTS